MKCQIFFSGKNKKNINFSSAENAQRVVKVKQGTVSRAMLNMYGRSQILTNSYCYNIRQSERN